MECHKLLKLYITNKGECKTWTVDMDWTMDWTTDWTTDWTMDCSHTRRQNFHSSSLIQTWNILTKL